MHAIYYPDYKYNPKKKNTKQLKQAAKELNGLANIIPILQSNVATSDTNYLLCSNNFMDYPLITNNYFLYLQQDYHYQKPSSQYVDYLEKRLRILKH